jgi:hypothetical protein
VPLVRFSNLIFFPFSLREIAAVQKDLHGISSLYHHALHLCVTAYEFHAYFCFMYVDLTSRVKTVRGEVDKLTSGNQTLQMYIDNLTKQLAKRWARRVVHVRVRVCVRVLLLCTELAYGNVCINVHLFFSLGSTQKLGYTPMDSVPIACGNNFDLPMNPCYQFFISQWYLINSLQKLKSQQGKCRKPRVG